MPIDIPIGVDILKHSNKSNPLINENPALEKVPPKEIAATRLCKPILRDKNPVNCKSCYIPKAIPSKIE